MSRIKIDFDNPIESDDGWLLLVREIANDRILLCHYSPVEKDMSISLFSLYTQPNGLSQRVSESPWGWVTLYVDGIKTTAEAEELSNLYYQDMVDQNFWWEKN